MIQGTMATPFNSNLITPDMLKVRSELPAKGWNNLIVLELLSKIRYKQACYIESMLSDLTNLHTNDQKSY